MKIINISDTHESHDKIKLPPGDILIHAGDFSYNGKPSAVIDFFKWMEAQPHKYKILVSGNHDWTDEKDPALFQLMLKQYAPSIIYLRDSGTEIEGIKIWGSPVQPEFCDWAFNKERGAEIMRHWNMIPEDTNILITHGPAYGILDKRPGAYPNLGCKDLLTRIQDLKELKLHVFGHIHEGHGKDFINGVEYVNASIMTIDYRPVNKPIVTEL